MTITTNNPGYSHTARSGTNLANFIQNQLNGGAVPGATSPTINGIPIGTTTPALMGCTYLDQSTGNGLTAIGTNRGTSLALTHAINVLSSVGSGTGVTLPSAATVGIGGIVYIFNADGTNAATIYAAGSDTIDTVVGSTGVTLTHAKRCIYIVVAANTYISAQLGVVSA